MSIFSRKNNKQEEQPKASSAQTTSAVSLDGKKKASDKIEPGSAQKSGRYAFYASRYLLRPLITEKSSSSKNKVNQYFFVVDKMANKISIAKAIEAVYGLRPVKVNMINKIGKEVRRGRSLSRRKNWKKAIVTLPPGKSIDIYEH